MATDSPSLLTSASPDRGEPRAAAAAAVAPDALTASLLEKHSAGEKLSPAEYGKLGAWKARLKAVFGGKPGNGSQPAPARPGEPARLGPLAAGEAPGDGLAPVPVDPGLVQRTCAAVLGRADAFTTRWVETEARRAGAEGAALDRFRRAASLPVADRQLIVDLSPDIAAELGLDPRQAPLWIAGAVLTAHGANLWLAVSELRELQAARQAEAGRGRSPAAETPEGKISRQDAKAQSPLAA